jgi:hypothetical protein
VTDLRDRLNEKSKANAKDSEKINDGVTRIVHIAYLSLELAKADVEKEIRKHVKSGIVSMRLWEGTEETYMHCLVEVNTRSDAIKVHDSMKNEKTLAFDKWIGDKCDGLVTEYFTPPKSNRPKNNNDNNKEKN